MSQVLIQNQDADIVLVLTNAGLPVEGLTIADITVEFRKEGGLFTAKSLADTAGTITSGNAETYALVNGQTLLVAVDGGGAQTALFETADFADIANATAAEIATVINTDVTGVTAAGGTGSVVITSDTTGATSSVQVTGGTANTALGFATTVQSGRTIFTEVGDGVYTVEFIGTTELDTVGSFTVKVTGATIDQFVSISTILAAGTTGTVKTVSTCVLTGHVFDANGNPIPGTSVSARVLNRPALENDVVYGDNLSSVTTDVNGEFFLELARLLEVEIFIPVANYRRQLTVPNQATANLFTGVV